MTPEVAATMTRLERLAQQHGVEQAVAEIERLVARRPDATASDALALLRGRLEVLGFAL